LVLCLKLLIRELFQHRMAQESSIGDGPGCQFAMSQYSKRICGIQQSNRVRLLSTRDKEQSEGCLIEGVSKFRGRGPREYPSSGFGGWIRVSSYVLLTRLSCGSCRWSSGTCPRIIIRDGRFEKGEERKSKITNPQTAKLPS